MTRRKIAVIGGGVSGITAGYVLSHNDYVTLFEADSRLGGHADTHMVVPPAGPPIGVDTGFIICNERTYPLLTKMFAELGVATQPGEMSMSVRCAGCGLQYAGQRGLGGLTPGLRRGRGRYLRMLGEIPRFHRAARRLLADGSGTNLTFGQFLEDGRFSEYFTAHFALPLVAAVWSCPPGTALSYPASYLLDPPTQAERDVLGAFGYTQNPAMLHTDVTLLPDRARRRLVTARLYECRIAHARTVPLRNVFTYRTYLWLVDLDHLPCFKLLGFRLLAGFQARDHLGDPCRSLRENLDHFLAGHGIDLGGGRVTMLAHARVLGYVFNPLTVYWCHRADGTLACVVAEVHNTYGGRHAYLLHTDDRGRAQVPKEFYVSPFYPVDGSYRMSLPEPDARLALSIVLGRPDGHSFAASVHGRGVPATARALIGAAARHPWSTAAVSARIRWQGVKLYRRGLRPVPRPAHLPQEGVQ